MTQPNHEKTKMENPSILESRRRLLKGTALTAPVLLTLPKIAAAVNSNEMCIEPVGGGITADEAKNPASYMVQVVRPVAYVQKQGNPANPTIAIVNSVVGTPTPSCDPGNWVDLQTLGDAGAGGKVFTLSSGVSCTGDGSIPAGTTLTAPNGLGTDSYVVVAPAPGDPTSQTLLVEVGATGGVENVGRYVGSTHIASQSCWASAMAGSQLPQ